MSGRGNPEYQARFTSTPFLCCVGKLQRSMANNEAPHIGHLIKEELARQERTVAWLARKLNYSRQNIYHIFESQWITTDVLLKICDILNYNFYKVYADYWDGVKNNVTQPTK